MISIPFIFHVPTLENIITFDKRIFDIFHLSRWRLIDLCLAQSRSVLLDHQFMGVVYYRVYNIDPCPAESVLFIIDPCPAESVLLYQRFPSAPTSGTPASWEPHFSLLLLLLPRLLVLLHFLILHLLIPLLLLILLLHLLIPLDTLPGPPPPPGPPSSFQILSASSPP